MTPSFFEIVWRTPRDQHVVLSSVCTDDLLPGVYGIFEEGRHPRLVRRRVIPEERFCALRCGHGRAVNAAQAMALRSARCYAARLNVDLLEEIVL